MDEVDGRQTAAVDPACQDHVQTAAVVTPDRPDRDQCNAGDRWPRLMGELLDLAKAADVFQGSDGRLYATVATSEGLATWPIDAPPFPEWLKPEYLETFRTAPEKGDLRDAIAVMGAWCRRPGAHRPVALRVASHAGHLYLDLGDATGAVVEITAQGWQVIDRPPVCFLRPPDLGALPRPVRGGTITGLARQFCGPCQVVSAAYSTSLRTATFCCSTMHRRFRRI